MIEYNPRLKEWLDSPELKILPKELWLSAAMPETVVEVWLSSRFMVQVNQLHKGAIRLSVNRTEPGIDRNFEDGISWDDLYAIKNVVGYGKCDAVEVYPKEIDLANVANMRHLFVVSDLLEFIWRHDEEQ